MLPADPASGGGSKRRKGDEEFEQQLAMAMLATGSGADPPHGAASNRHGRSPGSRGPAHQVQTIALCTRYKATCYTTLTLVAPLPGWQLQLQLDSVTSMLA